jgi:hypothetical protein
LCQGLQQIEAARSIFVGLGFTDDGFSQEIDSKPDFLRVTLAQRLDHIFRIFSRDELVRHSGNVPTQNTPAEPWSDPCQTNAGVNKGRKAIAHIGEIFFEVFDDFAGPMEGWKNIYKTKQL